MSILEAAKLHVFFPPMLGDKIIFANQSEWYVYQTGMGWTLVSVKGNWRTEMPDFPATFDMGLFIAEVQRVDRERVGVTA